ALGASTARCHPASVTDLSSPARAPPGWIAIAPLAAPSSGGAVDQKNAAGWITARAPLKHRLSASGGAAAAGRSTTGWGGGGRAGGGLGRGTSEPVGHGSAAQPGDGAMRPVPGGYSGRIAVRMSLEVGIPSPWRLCYRYSDMSAGKSAKELDQIRNAVTGRVR